VRRSLLRGFFQNDKANSITAREIVIEFVFPLCENGFVPGSVTAPHRADSIIRLTRGIGPVNVFVRAGLAIAKDAIIQSQDAWWIEQSLARCQSKAAKAALLLASPGGAADPPVRDKPIDGKEEDGAGGAPASTEPKAGDLASGCVEPTARRAVAPPS
jgi:hypothetical protein